jgi:uncharacterized membrane protein YfcA
MTPSFVLLLLLLGTFVGVVGGMLGIGGGVMIIPLLMLGFGFTQAKANGTSIAMLLPPIGIFAAISYARAGNIDWRFAAVLATGFALGAYFGANLVNSGRINPTALRILFAILLLYVASRVLFRASGRARAALETTCLMGAFLLTYAVFRLLGRRWSSPRDWSAVYRSKLGEAQEYDYEI